MAAKARGMKAGGGGNAGGGNDQALRKIVKEAGEHLREACKTLPPPEATARLQELMREAAQLKKSSDSADVDGFRNAIGALVQRLSADAPPPRIADETASSASTSVPPSTAVASNEADRVRDGGAAEAMGAATKTSQQQLGRTSAVRRPAAASSSTASRVAAAVSPTPSASSGAFAMDCAATAKGPLLHGLFEATARRVPDLPAVQWKSSESLTYAELDWCAGAVAGWLCRRGAGRGSIVGLHLDRGLEMVVAIIGALKSGSAYLPLLPTWPLSQRHFILGEAETRLLVTQTCFRQDYSALEAPATASAAAGITLLILDDCRAIAKAESPPEKRPEVHGSDLAYVIYTSGSTGKPKGVLMHHGGTASNIARNAGRSHREGTRSCFSNNYTFDVHLADVFKPLSVGGTVVITRDIFRIPPVHVVSTLPNRVAQAKVPEALHSILFTGEGITEAAVRPIPIKTRVLNIFGATEFFDATLKEVDRATFPKRLQSIGPPLPGVSLYVVDPRTLVLKPTGEPGELVVGGHQVAKGYMKRPDLTSEKFFEAHWLKGKPNSRVYRTGDLVRQCADGEFEYLGRAVHQVELRGQRFDLNTIESALCAIDGIVEAAVVVKIGADDDEPQLAAYVSPSSATNLVAGLADTLPAYMLPNLVVGVDTWPRTSSGKIDRNRLPSPTGDTNGTEQGGAPQDAKPARKRWMFNPAGSADDEDHDGGTSPAQAISSPEEQTASTVALEELASPAALVPEDMMDELETFVRIHAYKHGLVVFNKQFPAPGELPPVSLLPYPISRVKFEELASMGVIFSRLLDAVACDVGWLAERLAPVRQADPWTGRLLDIMEEVYGSCGEAKDARSEPRLFLCRQDYLPHDDSRYLQVEINTIGVAWAGMTDQLAEIHAQALRKFCPGYPGEAVPENKPGLDYANAMAAAHDLYNGVAPPESRESRVCFLAFESDHLELDQQHVAGELLRSHGIDSFKAYLHDRFELRPAGPGGALYVNDIEVSVVFFHCTFEPGHFKSDLEWTNRKIIELSRAIKAPSLLGHLAGCKKVQQLLTDADELRRFLPEEEVTRVMSVFAQQVDPSGPSSAACVADATAAPQNWVLKPQREGGGNNLYNEQLAATLQSASAEERAQYVLMEKIKSPSLEAVVMRGADVARRRAIAELGIFSAYLACGDRELVNTVGGAMFRTKDASSEEGGVCAGFGVIDTPVLVPRSCAPSFAPPSPV